MRLIDADELDFSYCDNEFDCIFVVDKAPTVDAVPIVHGRWITHNEGNPFEIYGECSICHFEQSMGKNLNYCSYCGAKMEGIGE